MTGAAAARLGLRPPRVLRDMPRRHRGLRPRHRPLERDVRRPAPLPDGIDHVIVERDDGGGRRRPHGAARAGGTHLGHN